MTHQDGKNLLLTLDLGCSIIVPGQKEARVATHKLLELLELSQQEVFTIQTGHPVNVLQQLQQGSNCQNYLLFTHFLFDACIYSCIIYNHQPSIPGKIISNY